MAKLDMAALISGGKVSTLDTARADDLKIVYISPDDIADNPKNEENGFHLGDVTALAESIELLGLQQPLVVEKMENGDKPYMLVAGHRRLAAWRLNREAYPIEPKWAAVPCLVGAQSSSILSELALIQTNTMARENTSYATMKALERTKNILAELKESGVELPGRMRNIAAEQIGISRTKAANLETINSHLMSEWMERFKTDALPFTTALEIARLPEAQQSELWNEYKDKLYPPSGYELMSYTFSVANPWWKINKKCPDGHSVCYRSTAEKISASHSKNGILDDDCPGCCWDCPKVSSCCSACWSAARRAQSNEPAPEAEPDEDEIAFLTHPLRVFPERVKSLREAAGLTTQELSQKLAAACGETTNYDAVGQSIEKISCVDDINDISALDFWALSVALGCSSDYLLGLSDTFRLAAHGT